MAIQSHVGSLGKMSSFKSEGSAFSVWGGQKVGNEREIKKKHESIYKMFLVSLSIRHKMRKKHNLFDQSA